MARAGYGGVTLFFDRSGKLLMCRQIWSRICTAFHCSPIVLISTALAKWIFNANELPPERQSLRHRPVARRCRVVTLLVLILLATLISIFLMIYLSFNPNFLGDRKSWHGSNVMLFTVLAFLVIFFVGATATMVRVIFSRWGWVEASRVNRHNLYAPTTNYIIFVISTFFSIAWFTFAAVIAFLGAWMFVLQPGLGLLGAVFLLGAVLSLQAAAYILNGRNPNLRMSTVFSLEYSMRDAENNGENILQHVRFRSDLGLSHLSQALQSSLMPRKKEYFLGLMLLIRIFLNLRNTVWSAASGMFSVGRPQRWSDTSAQQLTVNLIEAVFVSEYILSFCQCAVHRCCRTGPGGRSLLGDPDRQLHQLHNNLVNIANYSLLRQINALNASKMWDLYGESSTMEFLQALVHGVLALISLSLKVSAISPILTAGVLQWGFSDWKQFVSFVNNIAGITDLKAVEGKAVDQFIFSGSIEGDVHNELLIQYVLHNSWRGRLSLLLLETNGRTVRGILKSLLVINAWSTKKTQDIILSRDLPVWLMDEEMEIMDGEDLENQATASESPS